MVLMEDGREEMIKWQSIRDLGLSIVLGKKFIWVFRNVLEKIWTNSLANSIWLMGEMNEEYSF